MRLTSAGLSAVLVIFSAVQIVFGQSTPAHIIVPKSSLVVDGSTNTARTHLRIMVPAGGIPHGQATGLTDLPPFPGYFFETPASIACVYGLATQRVPGCNPNATTTNPHGGIGAIALVDAYDFPTATSDLAAFSQQFGLPPANFTVVYAAGSEPGVDPTGSWELEEALDIEWAHAMAPNAKIFLVEAASNYYSDLLPAVQLASTLVAGAGGGEVSMSWGGAEFQQETELEAFFLTPGVVYMASAGDGPGTLWPSVSPNVVSAGGTTLSRNPNTGNLIFENAWQDGGGGTSMYEPRPHFQDSIRWIVGPSRGTPDLSFDANPATGVWVIATNAEGDTSGVPLWYVVGGTSVSAPSLAGIINAAGGLRYSSQAENALIYRSSDDSRDFNDITYGNCGVYMDFTKPGWDFCTGVGSPLGYKGK